jgi:hypothetical protein
MIDADDIGTVAIVGSIPLIIIFVVIYFVWSVPVIDKCHEKGGVIVRIEGVDKCIDVSAIKEIK